MNTLKQLQGAGILLLLCAGVALALWYAAPPQPAHNPPATFNDAASLSAQGTYWRGRITAVGGAAAYQEFADFVAPKTIGQRHTLAHVFGGALYNTSGVGALGVCDARFSYGCFHEFLGRAIQEHGLSEVNELNEGCQHALATSPLSCQHGIGHGIMGYLGYTRSDLDKALAICKDLPFNDPIGGCYSGVFMEYNTRTMLGAESTIRPVADHDVYAPCDTLGEAYQKACAFWQPQWWQSVLYSGEVSAAAYAQLGAYCDIMEKDASLRRSCYEGLGTVTPIQVENDPTQTASLCEASTKSKLYQLYCKSYAANGIAIEVNKNAGHKVCAGLTGDSLEYCSAYADNKSNIAIPRVPPDLQ